MPQISNLVVKKNDGTTDVTYTAVVPSAGDKTPALWRNQSVGSAAAHQPALSLMSRNNGTGTARRLDGSLVYPTTSTGTDGKVTVSDKAIISISGVIPQGMPTADVNEAVAQAMNLFATALVKDSFKTGYAPT
jgi:hypothetical protein